MASSFHSSPRRLIRTLPHSEQFKYKKKSGSKKERDTTPGSPFCPIARNNRRRQEGPLAFFSAFYRASSLYFPWRGLLYCGRSRYFFCVRVLYAHAPVLPARTPSTQVTSGAFFFSRNFSLSFAVPRETLAREMCRPSALVRVVFPVSLFFISSIFFLRISARKANFVLELTARVVRHVFVLCAVVRAEFAAARSRFAAALHGDEDGAHRPAARAPAQQGRHDPALARRRDVRIGRRLAIGFRSGVQSGRPGNLSLRFRKFSFISEPIKRCAGGNRSLNEWRAQRKGREKIDNPKERLSIFTCLFRFKAI